MTNAIQTFEARVRAFFDTVKDELERFADKFLPAIEHIVEVALEDLAEIAGRAVLTEAPKLISGQEKFGNAVANVLMTIQAQGKTVGIGVAQQAVQTAYDTAVEVVRNK